jgi:hypothetical protein
MILKIKQQLFPLTVFTGYLYWRSNVNAVKYELDIYILQVFLGLCETSIKKNAAEGKLIQ